MKRVVRGCITTKNKTVKKLLTLFGPGFITGAADNDPSGIGTYAQAGALFGYKQLWLAPFSFPFMVILQEMCGRIGLVTGSGLAGVIKKNYSHVVLYGAVLLLAIVNTINIGADLSAMAAAARLLIPLPYYTILIGLTVGTVAFEVFIPYRYYVTYLKYLAFSLFAYVGVIFMVEQDWSAIFWATVIPSFSFSKEYIMNVVAVLGTTISPYLFFWQASHQVEEVISSERIARMGQGKPKINGDDIHAMQGDTLFGMFFSNLIMFFIILTVASTLHRAGITSIESSAQAAEALRPLAGEWASLLFALGIVGTGLLAVPILAGSVAYAVAEIFGWREGLSLTLREAPGFYGVIMIITVAGFFVDLTTIAPFKMLYYAAVLNGIVTPPLIFLLLFIANNKKIMGKYTNSAVSNFFGVTVGVLMTGAVGALVWTLLIEHA
ncbi:iron transporter [Candidatus Dependentiae bacterium HGW-Dependentiae-1]|nr:MAG: iron transporter [Candidatus Dependentiae bacterium HGW-Dependentiae-1]